MGFEHFLIIICFFYSSLVPDHLHTACAIPLAIHRSQVPMLPINVRRYFIPGLVFCWQDLSGSHLFWYILLQYIDILVIWFATGPLVH
jgi:hypothetical protein